MARRPRILVTLDTGEAERRGVRLPQLQLKTAYARAVERSGATPILVAPTTHPDVLEDLGALMDGLLITGGAFDIDPARYGRTQTARVDPPKPLRTRFEELLLRHALAARIPVLGVCGGMQLLNVVLGGTLLQDIGTEIPGALEHEQPSSPALPHHGVKLEPGTALHRAIGCDRIEVNSTHHQAVEQLGKGLEVLGRSDDGVIEAIGRRDELSVLGVEWHPELLDDPASQAIYRALAEAAERRIAE